MRKILLALLLVFPILSWSQGDPTIEAELKKLAWQVGPSEGRIGEKATIKVPDGYLFLESDNAGGTWVRFDRDQAGPNPQWPNFIIDVEHVAPSQISLSDWIIH